MRKTIAVGLVLLFFAAFFVLSPSCAATKPQDVSISYSLFIIGPNTGIGSFSATGAITDGGPVQETFRMNGKTMHGEVILTGSQGIILLQYQARLTPIGNDYEITGQFTIMQGDGAYARLHGVGSIDADFIGSSISGVYDGQVHWD